jgi:hypothetical protein
MIGERKFFLSPVSIDEALFHSEENDKVFRSPW